MLLLSWHTCYIVRGGALGVHQSWATTWLCCDTVYGGGVQEGTVPLPLLSAGFQSLPPLPTIKLGPSGADSRVCVRSRPLWVSPMNSPVRLGVSPAAASAPTGVFSQWFEALFPCSGALGCAVCHLVHQLLPRWPAEAFPAPFHNLPPHWVHQLPPCHGVLSTQLPVSVSVSSLSPCLSDFHTV